MNLGLMAKVAGLELGAQADGINVTGFAIDNRKVAPGTVFGAFPGSQVNGEDFIPAAIAAGAVAVVARPQAVVEGALHIASDEPRRLFAHLAAPFFEPMPDVVVAVTGTNGKTSCVEMVRQLWHVAGFSAASIGTLGVTTAQESVSTGLTTPDIVTFLSNLHGLAREGFPMSPTRRRAMAFRSSATRGRALSRGLHQPEPRPSRLSRHDGGLFRRQDAPVRRSGRGWRHGGDLGGRRVERGGHRPCARAGSS
jgi:hypothetical protein